MHCRKGVPAFCVNDCQAAWFCICLPAISSWPLVCRITTISYRSARVIFDHMLYNWNIRIHTFGYRHGGYHYWSKDDLLDVDKIVPHLLLVCQPELFHAPFPNMHCAANGDMGAAYTLIFMKQSAAYEALVVSIISASFSR
mmetsp:Transcript_6241/g.14125  ORF Transcript_6241/g.14125 Transcript_6241/m.14125 type:complete len:141 (-) Transcript_6241:1505-1927(-)